MIKSYIKYSQLKHQNLRDAMFTYDRDRFFSSLPSTEMLEAFVVVENFDVYFYTGNYLCFD